MNWLQRHVRPEQVRELSLLLLIIVAVLFFGSLIDNYYTSRTFNRIASSVAIITIVAVGQTLVVLTRNIDLSVGSIVGCTAYFVGTLLAGNNDLHPLVAVLLAVGARRPAWAPSTACSSPGAACPSIIVTLGTLAIYRGMLVDLSGAKTVTTDSLPAWLIDLPRLNFISIGDFDIRALFMLALAIVVIFQFGTSYLTVGRRFYAIGSNPDAAALIGLPMRRLVFIAFVLSGALAGLAGFVTLGALRQHHRRGRRAGWSCRSSRPSSSAASTSSADREPWSAPCSAPS